MSDDIESQMRAALRAVAPREEFSQKLDGECDEPASARRAHRAAAPRAGNPWPGGFPRALPRHLVLAVGVHQHLQQQRLQQSGLEARREVMEALRVTSQKLNLAYEAVKSQSTSLTDEGNSV